MNFRNWLSAPLAAVALFSSGMANAAAENDGWYIGVEGQYYAFNLGKKYKGAINNVSMTTSTYQKNKLGFGMHVGMRFNDNWGAELGMGLAGKARINNFTFADAEQTASIKHTHVYADAIGYLPMSDNASMLGTAGVEINRAKAYVNNAANIADSNDRAIVSTSKTSAGAGLGLGIHYQFAKNVAGRAILRYKVASNKSPIKNRTQGSIGLAYHF